MKPVLCACLLFILPCLLRCQITDAVLDSLKRPLPKGATARAQAEQLETILWHIFRTEEASYERFPESLESLYINFLKEKTGDSRFEHKVAAEIALFKGYQVLFEQPDKAKPFFESALRAYSALGDSSKMAISYELLCAVMSGVGDSIGFARYYQLANGLALHVKDPGLLSLFHCNIGIVCYDFGRYADAAAHYFEALALIEKYKTPEMIANQRDIYHNIAAVYNRLNDYENAVLYAKRAIQSAKETHQNPTDHYSMLGWTYLQKQDYENALEAFMQTDTAVQNNTSQNRIAEKTFGLAGCYRNLGEEKKALALAQKAVDMLPISKSLYGVAAMQELAACEFVNGMVNEALQHALLAFHSFSEGKNNRGASKSAELVSNIYKSKGNFRKALEYSELHFQFQQKEEMQQSTRQLAFGEFTRDNEVKNAKREAEVQAQLTRQRNIRYALFAVLGIMALLAFLLYNRFRLKQKTAEQLEAKNREVEAAKERAERSEAFKSRFLANMSHEIRTPLHGIAGYTDLLLETSLTEKQRRYLGSVRHSNERLTEVVNDILDISKLEAGEVKLRQVPFSPAQVAEDIREALSPRAEVKGIWLSVRIGENVPAAVLGDPTRLYQILMNLAGNAVKFTEKGEVKLTVDNASSSHPLTSLTFSLSDTGIGIPSEKLSSIFDSFQQAEGDTTSRFGGTGLGLTIARELVQLHGSDIQVESEVGKGSTFSFVLDLPLANAADLEQKPNMDGELHFTQPLKILLADDNAFNREIATEAIRRHFENAEIVEAENGRAAVETLHATSLHNRFDLVLMDMQMPKMNGLEATRHIRQLGSEIPIIALTASATPAEIEQALSSGMDRHLPKPFKPHELAAAIAATLGLKSDPPKDFPKLQDQENHHLIPHPSSLIPKNYDLTYLRDFCGGDEAQVRHFIEKFEQQCPFEIERLEVAFRNKDGAAIYQAAHSLKPQLEFMGMKAVVAVAVKLEDGARIGEQFDSLDKLFASLKAMLTPTLTKA